MLSLNFLLPAIIWEGCSSYKCSSTEGLTTLYYFVLIKAEVYFLLCIALSGSMPKKILKYFFPIVCYGSRSVSLHSLAWSQYPHPREISATCFHIVPNSWFFYHILVNLGLISTCKHVYIHKYCYLSALRLER